MAIADDFSVAANGDIRYTGTTDNYTVLEFHRWLQDLADNASTSSDDLVDITSDTPTDKSFDTIINVLTPYNIDAEVSRHLYAGSIIQTGGDEIFDGLTVFAPQGTYVQAIQNGALVTPNFWTNGLNADATRNISHQFMLQVRTGGADIDDRKLIFTSREFGETYAEWVIGAGTGRGENTVSLAPSNDLNNQTAEATVATWTTITNTTEGYIELDVDNNGTPEPYYSEWNRDSFTINQFYERMKWLTRRGTVSTLYGLDGNLFRGITHEVALTTPRTGTFNAFEPVTWPGGTGQMLAIDDTTTGTKMWIQLITGSAPDGSDTITGSTSSATATNSGTPTSRTVSTPFIGQSTGSAIIGAYGIGIELADLTNADQLFDLNNVNRVPPNNVQFSVGNLTVGQTRILVAPESGGGIDFSQLASSTGNNSGDPDFVCQTAIPLDTPSSGTFRVLNTANGTYDLYDYSSYSGATFTLDVGSHPTGLDRTYTNGDNAWVSYIDKLAGATTESFTGIYQSDRPLFIRARDGGGTPIKTAETTATFTSSPQTVNINQVSDA